MGLFSSKTKTYVGTAAVRAVKDEMLPNSVLRGVTRGIFSTSDPDPVLGSYIIETLAQGIATKAERMYQYAAQGKYTFGLPGGQTWSSAAGTEALEEQLSQLEGQAVQLEYFHTGPANELHLAWMYLVSQYGYDPRTNQLPVLSAAKGYPVYLHDLRIVIPQSMLAGYPSMALAQWGPPPTAGVTPNRKNASDAIAEVRQFTPVGTDVTASAEYAVASVSWAPAPLWWGDAYQTVQSESLRIELAPLSDPAADYHQARYTLADGQVKFLLYRVGSNTNPALETLREGASEISGQYFPFGYFRFNKVMDNADKDSAAYKTGQKLMGFLGMDIDQVSAAIEGNPDIADVTTAMLMMAVPAVTSNPIEARYLFEYFERIYYSRPDRLSASTPTYGSGSGVFKLIAMPLNATTLQDGRSRITIGDNGIVRRLRAGSIGKIGSHTASIVRETFTVTYDNYGESGPGQTEALQERTFHVYRKQVTSGMYEEYTVCDLQMRYYVVDNHYTPADEEDNILLVPLDRAITRQYSLPDREELYARSLHYIFNSVQYVKVKWYQQGFFQFLMMAVSVFLAVWSGGASLEALSTAVASGSAAAISAAVLNILVDALIGMAVAAGIQLVVKAIGGEFAMLLAVVAIAFAGFIKLGGSGVQGAPWAQQLLQMGNGLMNGVSSYYEDELKGIAGEFDSLKAEKEAADTEFARANKLLENDNQLSPFVIFGEKPSDYFNRTVHSGNIGMLSIGAISDYVDNALRLPTVAETLGDGGEIYG